MPKTSEDFVDLEQSIISTVDICILQDNPKKLVDFIYRLVDEAYEDGCRDTKDIVAGNGPVTMIRYKKKPS